MEIARIEMPSVMAYWVKFYGDTEPELDKAIFSLRNQRSQERSKVKHYLDDRLTDIARLHLSIEIQPAALEFVVNYYSVWDGMIHITEDNILSFEALDFDKAITSPSFYYSMRFHPEYVTVDGKKIDVPVHTSSIRMATIHNRVETVPPSISVATYKTVEVLTLGASLQSPDLTGLSEKDFVQIVYELRWRIEHGEGQIVPD